jgi:acetyl-CoA acyltransferase
MGNANGAGEDNHNVARMARLLAGRPVEVPGVTVNRLCASGSKPRFRGRARSGSERPAWSWPTGGVDVPSASRDAQAVARGNLELVDTTIGWRLVNLRMPEAHTESLGQTAENVAERHSVSREDQDHVALESHRRAVAAVDAGRFDDEIVAVDVPQPKGEAVTIHSDEARVGTPQSNSSHERRARP